MPEVSRLAIVVSSIHLESTSYHYCPFLENEKFQSILASSCYLSVLCSLLVPMGFLASLHSIGLWSLARMDIGVQSGQLGWTVQISQLFHTRQASQLGVNTLQP